MRNDDRINGGKLSTVSPAPKGEARGDTTNLPREVVPAKTSVVGGPERVQINKTSRNG